MLGQGARALHMRYAEQVFVRCADRMDPCQRAINLPQDIELAAHPKKQSRLEGSWDEEMGRDEEAHTLEGEESNRLIGGVDDTHPDADCLVGRSSLYAPLHLLQRPPQKAQGCMC